MAKCKKGFKRRDRKCIKISKSFKKSKRSFNPFKMWGSYLGVYLLSFLVVVFFDFSDKSLIEILIEGSTWFLDSGYWTPLSNLRISILVMVFGFLLGWGIHSLVRKVRK